MGSPASFSPAFLAAASALKITPPTQSPCWALPIALSYLWASCIFCTHFLRPPSWFPALPFPDTASSRQPPGTFSCLSRRSPSAVAWVPLAAGPQTAHCQHWGLLGRGWLPHPETRAPLLSFFLPHSNSLARPDLHARGQRRQELEGFSGGGGGSLLGIDMAGPGGSGLQGRLPGLAQISPTQVRRHTLPMSCGPCWDMESAG